MVSDIAAQPAMEIEESLPILFASVRSPGDVNLFVTCEETLLDYGSSGREDNAELSCDEEDLWESLTTTPLKPAQVSLVIYLPKN